MSDTHTVQQRWQEEAQAIRRRLPDAGVCSPEQLKLCSGLQFLEQVVTGELPPPPMAKTLDFLLVSIASGNAVLQANPAFEHYNSLGMVHGGYLSTLLDSAAGCAVHSMLPAGIAYTTLELKINFVRPPMLGNGPIRAHGKVIHCGTRTALAEAQIIGSDGKLYAHGSTTCLLISM